MSTCIERRRQLSHAEAERGQCFVVIIPASAAVFAAVAAVHYPDLVAALQRAVRRVKGGKASLVNQSFNVPVQPDIPDTPSPLMLSI